ncbi:Flavin-binding monooxygenase-like protein 15 [Elsinoe fawcettii]|nr:Flavin-binding monooxygenase-like protein 15 [Elsinoe fawcettii]
MSVPLPVPPQPAAIAEQAANPQEHAMRVQARYAEERNKRVKDEGLAQYIDLLKSDKFKHYSQDPWIDRSKPGKRPSKDTCKALILGAGYGALLFAVRLVETGTDPKDILFVDQAGGFGGTWYWNRYPGLMCDVESYIYMPLLEETGYMPKHKYAYGPELREHADRIATKWNLQNQLVPSATIQDSIWDEGSSTWRTTIHLDQFYETTTITSNFLLLASGVLNTPQIPNIPGIDTFKGHIFHTARWDYKYCGGSPENQTLENLKDKRVAIIGTGATAIQVVPALAKVVKHLTVFQRTPSAVDERGQRPTDPAEWRSTIAAKPGWQYDRMYNFSAHLSNLPDKPAENLINDGWTKFPSYSALVGGPACANLTPETIGAHIAQMHALDFPRQERVRARVDALVHDRTTAEALKPWYPGWCKRPCFHDEYLQSFNLPNVSLVDTAGRGVDAFTATGIVFDGKEHPFDLVVMSTGFNSPAVGNPASKAGVKVTGRDGLTMDAKWAAGVGTLHGVVTRGLPNLFFPGPTQAGASANHVCTLNVITSHVAHIIAEAEKRAGPGGRVVVEPSEEGEMGWTGRIMQQAISYAVLMGCTPSYINSEGEADREKSMEEKMKGARSAGWSRGILDYEKVIRAWEGQGKLEGLVVEVKA